MKAGQKARLHRRDAQKKAYPRLPLMQTPDFGGRKRQPFHFLRDIIKRRVIVGLRYNSKKVKEA